MTEAQARQLKIGDRVVRTCCNQSGHDDHGTVQSIGHKDGFIIIWYDDNATTSQSYRAPYDMADINLEVTK